MSQFENNRKKEFASVLRQLKQNWQSAHGSLTDEDLAEAVDVSRESVNRWMNGSSYPSKGKLSALAEFFHVPVSFFSEKKEKQQGLTLIDENAHSVLEEQCEKLAEHIGLSPAFVSFIKESPGLSDLIVSLCWVNPQIQSLDPSVPEIKENVFQFVSSSGVKVYLPKEVIQMLRNVQEDLSDYLLFLLQKHRKVIDEYFTDHKGIEPASRYALIRRGMSGLSDLEAAMIDMYRLHPELSERRKGERIAHFLRNVDKKIQQAADLADASAEEVRNDE